MSLKLWWTEINKIYLWSTEINKAYLWNTLVYDNTTTPNWLLNNLVSYYKCDTSWSFPDAHWSNDWTINGATYTASWLINWAYDFDWSNDYINIPYQVNNATSFTWNLWINWDSITNTEQYFISTIWPQSSYREWVIFGVSSSWTFRIVVYDGTQYWIRWIIQTNSHWMTNWNYYMVTLRYTESTKLLEALVNNILIESVTLSSSITHSDPCTFGRYNNDSIYRPYNWIQDEIWLWETVLTLDQSTALYNSWLWLSYDNFTT